MNRKQFIKVKLLLRKLPMDRFGLTELKKLLENLSKEDHPMPLFFIGQGANLYVLGNSSDLLD